MSRSLLERVEDLATEHFGRGACVSVDRDRVDESGSRVLRTQVRVWNAKGETVLETAACVMKIEAIQEAMRSLVRLSETKDAPTKRLLALVLEPPPSGDALVLSVARRELAARGVDPELFRSGAPS